MTLLEFYTQPNFLKNPLIFNEIPKLISESVELFIYPLNVIRVNNAHDQLNIY